MLRGRWDLGLERALLIPKLQAIRAEAASEERRVRQKTRRLVSGHVTERGLTREGERGVRDMLKSSCAETTGGL